MQSVVIFVLAVVQLSWTQAPHLHSISSECSSNMLPFSKLFQCYSNLFHICITQRPVPNRGGGLHLGSVLKIFSMLLGLDSHMCILRGVCGHTLLYGIIFLSSSCSVIPLAISNGEIPFNVLDRNLRLFFNLTLAVHFHKCVHVWGQEVEGQGERKSNRVSPILWVNTSSSSLGRSFSFHRALGACCFRCCCCWCQ